MVIAALLVLRAEARTAALRGSVSPNQRYELRVSEHGKQRSVTYDIVRRHDGRVLLRIDSSYQPEEGEWADWCWNHSLNARIAWSAGSNYVAIDEQAHNYIGRVFVIWVKAGRAKQVAIPEKQILACTGFHWDRKRVRIRDRGGFFQTHTLSLSLAGTVPTGLGGGLTTYAHREFAIDVQLIDRQATIKRCYELSQ